MVNFSQCLVNVSQCLVNFSQCLVNFSSQDRPGGLPGQSWELPGQPWELLSYGAHAERSEEEDLRALLRQNDLAIDGIAEVPLISRAAGAVKASCSAPGPRESRQRGLKKIRLEKKGKTGWILCTCKFHIRASPQPSGSNFLCQHGNFWKVKRNANPPAF